MHGGVWYENCVFHMNIRGGHAIGELFQGSHRVQVWYMWEGDIVQMTGLWKLTSFVYMEHSVGQSGQ